MKLTDKGLNAYQERAAGGCDFPFLIIEELLEARALIRSVKTNLQVALISAPIEAQHLLLEIEIGFLGNHLAKWDGGQ